MINYLAAIVSVSVSIRFPQADDKYFSAQFDR